MSDSIGEFYPIEGLTPHPKNPRQNEEAVSQIARSIERFGFTSPIIAREQDKTIIAGHTRWKAAQKIGLSKVPVIFVNLSVVDAELLMIADNKLGEKADWDTDKLSDLLSELREQGEDLDVLGFDDGELEDLFVADPISEIEDYLNEDKLTLFEKFGAPPLSVIDSRQGYMIKRKRKWHNMGIKSHEGREGLEDTSGNFGWQYDREDAGSVFDPAIAEICYSWFNVKKGIILDPFAGGSVRGVVACELGYKYIGHEIRKEQIDANMKQCQEISSYRNWDSMPVYILGDSNKTIEDSSEKVDMIFSCPPYFDLEKYSDLEDDISNMDYQSFLEIYRSIIKKACVRLNDNSFAVFVVGEVRNKKGGYINFVADTISAFIDAGLNYYNEIVNILTYASITLRAERPMRASRKIGKTHQNILVFHKGDLKNVSSKWRHEEIEIEVVEE